MFMAIFNIFSPSIFPLADISPAEVSKYAMNFRTTCSCVIKVVEPRRHATSDDLTSIVSRVNKMEDHRSISPWNEEHVPEEIVAQSPDPGY
jgi:hypothetical protein